LGVDIGAVDDDDRVLQEPGARDNQILAGDADALDHRGRRAGGCRQLAPYCSSSVQGRMYVEIEPGRVVYYPRGRRRRDGQPGSGERRRPGGEGDGASGAEPGVYHYWAVHPGGGLMHVSEYQHSGGGWKAGDTHVELGGGRANCSSRVRSNGKG